MKINKILILAFDGLEYELVERYRLKALKQKIYGYIDVSSFKHVLTPIIWRSFITGLEPGKHKVYSWWRFSNNRTLDRIMHWIRYNFPIIRNMSNYRLKQVARLFGIKIKPTDKTDIKYPTIFDYAKKPIALFIPSYNEEPWIRDEYSKAMEKNVKAFEKVLWEVHRYRVNKFLKLLDKDWDLFMAWFDLADWIGHLYMGKSNIKMIKAYMELNKLATEVSRRINDKTLLIIVSDHGMASGKHGGEHSPKAYYSLNKDIKWKPEKITDYYHLIKEILRTNISEEGKT